MQTIVNLTPRRIESSADVETLRRIRNACRNGFAHDTREIGMDQQRFWWNANRASLIGYLYTNADGDDVGYGLLRQTADGRWWSSVAVLAEHARNGHGKAITAHIVRQSPTGEVYAQARKDNPAADKLHDRHDWEVVDEDDRLLHYRTKADLSP